MVHKHQSSPDRHQYVAQTVQSHKAAPVPKYASTRARDSKSNWYINKGLDTFLIWGFLDLVSNRSASRIFSQKTSSLALPAYSCLKLSERSNAISPRLKPWWSRSRAIVKLRHCSFSVRNGFLTLPGVRSSRISLTTLAGRDLILAILVFLRGCIYSVSYTHLTLPTIYSV